MSLKYIRDYYKVPAKRGMAVRYATSDGDWIEGVITGAKGSHLRIRTNGYKHSSCFHPTWWIQYLTPNGWTDFKKNPIDVREE